MRALALLPLLALSSPCWATDPCDELPKPSVTAKRLEERITYNTTYGYRSLTNLGATLARPGKQVLGLTRGNAIAKFTTNTASLIDPSGRWECASPQITLTFGFTPVTVYVAREFPQGSCAYKEIHEHEMRHFKTYQDHMAGIEKTLNDTLANRFATAKVWRGPAGQTAAQLQRELDERWLPYVQREIQKVEVAQALIDTPEEYERVTNSCDGEIRNRLR